MPSCWGRVGCCRCLAAGSPVFSSGSTGHLTLFDCGEGTQIAWRESGWGFRRLGAICISHTHADHVAGLPGLLHAVANAGRTEPIERIRARGHGRRRARPARDRAGPAVRGSGDRAAGLANASHSPGGLIGSCELGDHALPVLAYRVDLVRGRAFLPERARALGVPIDLWSQLQAGEPVSWDGGHATADAVLGPPRPGLAVAYVTDTRPVPTLPQFLEGVESPGL